MKTVFFYLILNIFFVVTARPSDDCKGVLTAYFLKNVPPNKGRGPLTTLVSFLGIEFPNKFQKKMRKSAAKAKKNSLKPSLTYYIKTFPAMEQNKIDFFNKYLEPLEMLYFIGTFTHEELLSSSVYIGDRLGYDFLIIPAKNVTGDGRFLVFNSFTNEVVPVSSDMRDLHSVNGRRGRILIYGDENEKSDNDFLWAKYESNPVYELIAKLSQRNKELLSLLESDFYYIIERRLMQATRVDRGTVSSGETIFVFHLPNKGVEVYIKLSDGKVRMWAPPNNQLVELTSGEKLKIDIENEYIYYKIINK